MTTEPQIAQPDESNPTGWVIVGDEAFFFDQPKTDEELAEIVARLRD